MYRQDDHTFVICAYGESFYIEECIKSLKNQSLKTHIIMTTSTPSEYLSKIAIKHGIELFITDEPSNIATDWNFGLSKVTTKLATIAHQDDIYCPTYAESVISKINQFNNPIIAFTDYGEIRGNKMVDKNRLLKIKRIMLLPLHIKRWNSSIWIRRKILSFGDAISCPTVTYVKDNIDEPLFQPGYKCNIDWQAWEKLSKKRGDFVFCNKILMYHRIHSESTTSGLINDIGRGKEDLEMLEKFWPGWIARLIEKKYKNAEKSNG